MKQYVENLVPITAVQFSDTDEAVIELQNLGLDPVRIDYKNKELIVRTPEGETRLKEGDYVVKGVCGVIFPCRKDIFEKTYTRHNSAEDTCSNYMNPVFFQ